MNIEQIAEVAHMTNKVYCEMLEDFSQPRWIDAPDWQKKSAINGVKFHLDNPSASQSESHEKWLQEKYDDGWKYGEVKNPEKKEHPCCVQYNDLPIEQRVKDALFIGVVRAMKVLL